MEGGKGAEPLCRYVPFWSRSRSGGHPSPDVQPISYVSFAVLMPHPSVEWLTGSYMKMSLENDATEDQVAVRRFGPVGILQHVSQTPVHTNSKDQFVFA